MEHHVSRSEVDAPEASAPERELHGIAREDQVGEPRDARRSSSGGFLRATPAPKGGAGLKRVPAEPSSAMSGSTPGARPEAITDATLAAAMAAQAALLLMPRPVLHRTARERELLHALVEADLVEEPRRRGRRRTGLPDP